MRSLRRRVKGAVEQMLGSPAALRLMLRRLTGRRLILAYHNVVEGPGILSGQASLHLPMRNFRRQLDVLQESGLAVVAVTDPLAPTDSPTVAITFDDAYAGAVDLAIPELAQRRLPATLFVAPGLLGCAGVWWDRLGDPRVGGVPPTVRQAALERYGGQDKRVLEAAKQHKWPLFPTIAAHRIADEMALARAVARHPGLTLGAHTWSHLNLAVADAATTAVEVQKSLTWLQTRFPDRTITWLAYPYGLSSAASHQGAMDAGVEDAVLVSGGWDRPATARLARPRLNVTAGLTTSGFRMRVAGFIP